MPQPACTSAFEGCHGTRVHDFAKYTSPLDCWGRMGQMGRQFSTLSCVHICRCANNKVQVRIEFYIFTAPSAPSAPNNLYFEEKDS